MNKCKKIVGATIAGCMLASALMVGAGAMPQEKTTLKSTELSSAPVIVSSVPMSDEEIMDKYNEYQRNGAFALDDTTIDTQSLDSSENDSAPFIVSSEPITDSEIEQEMKKYSENFLTDVKARGSSIPRSVYDLGKTTYTGTFNFKDYTYTNYCFLNPYGYLNVEVSATTGNSKDKSYTVALYKKSGNTYVEGIDVAYGQKVHLVFPRIAEKEKYYIKLSKGNTGTYAKGTIFLS